MRYLIPILLGLSLSGCAAGVIGGMVAGGSTAIVPVTASGDGRCVFHGVLFNVTGHCPQPR